MPSVNQDFNSTPFMNIISGRLLMNANEGTPGAVSREKKNGKVVWEVPYKAWRGVVKGWNIKEFEYEGKKIKSLNVNFDDVTLSLSSKMMTEFIKKFSNCKVDEEITVSPYPDFVGKDGRPKKSGLTIIQNGERIYDHFSEWKDEVLTQKNGYPVPEKKWNDMSDSEKKIYNIRCDEFFENWVLLHPINNIAVETTEPPAGTMHDEEEIDLSSVPF